MHRSPASPPLRWSRAALLGAVVLAVGAIAHTSASGLLPGPGSLVALYSLCVLGCAALLGREASTVRLIGLTVGGQSFVHTALSALAGHQGQAPASHQHQHASASTTSPEITSWDPRSGQSFADWERQTFAAGYPDAALPDWATHAFLDMAAHPAMALTHVLAAVAVGCWLAVGERALWAVLRIARCNLDGLAAAFRVLSRGLRGFVFAQLRRLPRPEGSSDLFPRLPVWCQGTVTRGPPLLLLTR